MDQGSAAARETLQGSRRSVIHLITDGMPGNQSTTIAEAQLCREAGIVVRCTGTMGANLEFLKLLAGGEENKRAELVPTAGLRGAIEATAAAAALPAPSRKT